MQLAVQDKNSLMDWLRTQVADVLGTDPESLDVDAPLTSLGLDSVALVAIAGELGEILGLDVDPAIVVQHNSISALAEKLATEARSVD